MTEIAELAVECMGLKEKPLFEYTGGDRGWKGDVPVVRLNTDRIKSLGWTCQKSAREALKVSIQQLMSDERTSRI